MTQNAHADDLSFSSEPSHHSAHLPRKSICCPAHHQNRIHTHAAEKAAESAWNK